MEVIKYWRPENEDSESLSETTTFTEQEPTMHVLTKGFP